VSCIGLTFGLLLKSVNCLSCRPQQQLHCLPQRRGITPLKPIIVLRLWQRFHRPIKEQLVKLVVLRIDVSLLWNRYAWKFPGTTKTHRKRQEISSRWNCSKRTSNVCDLTKLIYKSLYYSLFWVLVFHSVSPLNLFFTFSFFLKFLTSQLAILHKLHQN
jgi:hypothetical protein